MRPADTRPAKICTTHHRTRAGPRARTEPIIHRPAAAMRIQSTSLPLPLLLALPFSYTGTASPSAGSITTHHRMRPHGLSARSPFFTRSQHTKRTGCPSQYFITSMVMPPGRRSAIPLWLNCRKS